MNNKFRIIIASYNNSEWVDYNITSVLNQTYKNYEVYFIDDESTDNTFSKASRLINGDDRFKMIRNNKNMGGTHNHLYYSTFELEDDNTIICLLDGDDWLYDITVLEKLNEFYNRFDVWMTYGGMIVYTDNGFVEANPHNSPYPYEIHKSKTYRQDSWRASHFRTYRGYLWKSVDQNDMYELGTNKYYNHAGDLALQFPCLEICPKEKIGVVPFQTYVYNATQKNTVRTSYRQMDNKHWDIEHEIRNRRPYREGLGSGKCFHVNVIGYPPLKNPIQRTVSVKHNFTKGDFDVNLITDFDIPKFIGNEIRLPGGKIIADLHESRNYSEEMNSIYTMVLENHTMFDRVLTYDEILLEKIPNAKLRLCMSTYFIDSQDSFAQIYTKSKNISCISSDKSFLEGHRVRLNIINHILSNETKTKFDMFGNGFHHIENKIDALKSYRFSISIENGHQNNMATEKISDCFLTGTIPIYYGCPNIGEHFDSNGIITFNTAEELVDIVNRLNLNGEEEYNSRIDSIRTNYQLAKYHSYSSSDDYFEKHIKDLISKS